MHGSYALCDHSLTHTVCYVLGKCGILQYVTRMYILVSLLMCCSSDDVDLRLSGQWSELWESQLHHRKPSSLSPLSFISNLYCTPCDCHVIHYVTVM